MELQYLESPPPNSHTRVPWAEWTASLKHGFEQSLEKGFGLENGPEERLVGSDARIMFKTKVHTERQNDIALEKFDIIKWFII